MYGSARNKRKTLRRYKRRTPTRKYSSRKLSNVKHRRRTTHRRRMSSRSKLNAQLRSLRQAAHRASKKLRLAAMRRRKSLKLKGGAMSEWLCSHPDRYLGQPLHYLV